MQERSPHHVSRHPVDEERPHSAPTDEVDDLHVGADDGAGGDQAGEKEKDPCRPVAGPAHEHEGADAHDTEEQRGRRRLRDDDLVDGRAAEHDVHVEEAAVSPDEVAEMVAGPPMDLDEAGGGSVGP